jgi:heme exporter protein CcmD
MEWLAMGKYGAYVWSSFGLTFAVVIICAVQARRRHDAVIQDIKRRIRIMESR